MQDPDRPRKQLSYSYRDGDWSQWTDHDRSADTPTIDLADFSPTVLAGLVAGAQDSLATFVGVPDAVVSHTVVRNMGEPEILIYASDDLGRGGYFETTLAGEVTEVNPYRP